MPDPASPPRAPHPPHPRPAGNPPADPAAQADDSPFLRLLFLLYKSILSPLAHAISPTQCLYLPTCSEYAYIALHRFGPWRGSWLALRRLARCHPFAQGGLDPVPPHRP